MYARLHLAGKVKVDIRLFVAVKAKKRLKRNIMAVNEQLCAAFRAIFIGQIKAVGNLAVLKENAMLTFWAKIVRHKAVYL